MITTAEARGQQRLAEVNRTVPGNRDTIIDSLRHRKQPTMRSDNSIHLTTAAKRRHELTRAKAIAALHELDSAGDPITFESVADHAGVSRSWLYTQTDLKDEIRRLCARNQHAHATATPVDWRVGRPATVRSSHEIRAGAPGFRRPIEVCAKQSVAGPTCHRNGTDAPVVPQIKMPAKVPGRRILSMATISSTGPARSRHGGGSP